MRIDLFDHRRKRERVDIPLEDEVVEVDGPKKQIFRNSQNLNYRKYSLYETSRQGPLQQMKCLTRREICQWATEQRAKKELKKVMFGMYEYTERELMLRKEDQRWSITNVDVEKDSRSEDRRQRIADIGQIDRGQQGR